MIDRIRPEIVKVDQLAWGDERTYQLAATNEKDALEEASFWGLRVAGFVQVFEIAGLWYAKDYVSIGD